MTNGPRPLFVCLILILLATPAIDDAPLAAEMDILTEDQARVAREMIHSRHCVCRCGRWLPASRYQPSCFGCSVGKWDMTYIIEGLTAGRSRADIAIDLTDDTLVDVFADYDHPELPTTWSRATRIAKEFGVDRVVLRPLGRTESALRAVRLVEFARHNGRFTAMHEQLVAHDGPWDSDTLTEFAEKLGLDADVAVEYMRNASVEAQINKNRQHVDIDGIDALPAVSVNRDKVANTDDAVRRAILAAVMDSSM